MSIAENFASVSARIAAACARAGRDPKDIRLVCVSKNHPRESVLAAAALGARLFGENRVQEALEKFPLPAGSPPCELHLIGRLQKNKVRKILPIVLAVHSIDSLELLAAVDRVAGELGLRRDVFLQVNTSGEASKGGFEPAELEGLALPATPNLRVIGLMTMGPTPPEGQTPSPEETRRCFQALAAMRRTLQARGGQFSGLAHLSMGMTGDFEIAIEEGAHYLRIGTAVFGSRA